MVLAWSGYGCLTLYDALGLRFAGARVPYPRLALISFMGYAIGHNVGLNTLSGGAVRYRAYSALGLTAKQIATVIAFGTLTFALGRGGDAGAVPALGGRVVRFGAASAPLARSSSPAACCSPGSRPISCWLASRHEPLRWRKIVIPVPSPRIAFAQIAVACGDLLCAAGVLYVLLPPQAAIGFAAFAGIYLIAIAAGIISNVPGGVGVFESVFLLLFRSVPADQLLGALLAYRIIYYLSPLCRGPRVARRARVVGAPGTHGAARAARSHLAQCRHAAGERVRGVRRRRGAALLRRNAGPRQPPGGCCTISCRCRSSSCRICWAAPSGVGLLVLANGLYRRLDAAWYLTMWLLCAGVLLSLLKGFDYEEATILGAVAVVLVSARERFRRRASLIEQRFSASWVVAVLLVLGAATMAGLVRVSARALQQ